MSKKSKIFIFSIGEQPSAREKKENYIKKLLGQYGCLEVQKILSSADFFEEHRGDAHTFWTECGHRIRKKLNHDNALEIILKKVLPAYSGHEITLYRGENKERYEKKYMGFCWTSNREIAEMFARGLNSFKSGGVLLQYQFNPSQIIAGPSQHSIYLGENEFTVSPSSIDFKSLVLLKSYPSTCR